jgi:PAS domain S-box-containing protein
MINFFINLFGTDFMPHVYCLRSPGLVWIHALSDAAIAVAYLLIPLGLVRLVQRRRDLAFHWLFFLFAVFILSCGATHVLSIVTLWYPIYRFDALVKIITAAASLLTAALLFRLIPAIAALPSPEQWRVANEELKKEIDRRNAAEDAMRSLNADLERRVEDRTKELEKRNIQLQDLNAAWDLAHGFIRGMDGQITFWCEGSEQLYGWKKEEATGKLSHQLLQTTFPKPLAEIEEELRDKGTWAGELVHTTKAGDRLQIATHWILRRDASDGVTSVIEVNNDITDRLRADEAMQRLADIVESSKDAIIGSSLDGEVTSWNSSAEALFGYSASEMIGQSVHRLTPFELLDEELCVFKDAGSGDGVKRYETVRRAKDGRAIDVSMTVSPIRDSSGRVIGTSMISQDISESKAQKEAIRVSEEQQRLAVDAGQIGLWYVDVASGRWIFTQRFKELHGIREDEFVPDYPAPLTVIHEEDRTGVTEAVKLMFQGGADLAVEYRTRGLDFRTKWVQCRGKAQLDASGKVKGIHGTVVDLTARREMEDKLRRMNTELEQFAYAAAHDLQEPLRNVALAAQLLKRNGLSAVLTHDRLEQQPPLLNLMLDNALRMEAMVKDLLAYSRALEGVGDSITASDANKVLETALRNLAAATAEKAVVVTKDLLPKVSMAETHLLQLFQNLISNALKYGARSPLQIHVGARIRAGDVLLFVRDNGVGISPQFHERAFGMFKRLNRDSASGTGIGLAVCKRIVEHYGGHIWIESQVGEGATFFFTVPSASGN